jgi:zinc and cadmium transporter
MIQPLQLALPYLILIFALTWFVGSIPTWRNWHEMHLHQFISFSAGVLLSTAFIHILPEVFEHADHDRVGFYILAGFLFLFILEKFAMVHPCEEHHCDYHQLGMSAFIGIGLHSFFDGLAMATSLVHPTLAKAVFIAIVVHKMPSSFALASLFKSARWSNRRIHLMLALFSLIIPASTIISIFFLEHLPPSATGIALSFSLGSFLFIATSDFLPQIHQKYSTKIKNFIAFLIGIVIMSLFLVNHHH